MIPGWLQGLSAAAESLAAHLGEGLSVAPFTSGDSALTKG
jgi:hypothetical protein